MKRLLPVKPSARHRRSATRFLLASLIPAAFAAGLAAAEPSPAYKVETVPLPAQYPPQVGGLDFDRDGNLYVALRMKGDVLVTRPAANPADFKWRVFASGFDSSLGLAVPEPGRIVIMQMPELTEATDTDGDGIADRYLTLANDWGLSGNYHETPALAPDGHGGYFVALGTASYRGPTFEQVRGDYSAFGRRGRNYSAVSYRGWIMHYQSDGTLVPVASGFRMHNGIMHDDEDNLWSSDNQGDWKASSPLYHVEPGKFYGHVSSLVWEKDWPVDRDPLAFYSADLKAYNQRRTRAAVEIPWALIQSGSQPVQIPRNGAFGPFGGQILLPDASGSRIARIMVEKVGGAYQGAVTLFLGNSGLEVNNNRAVFSPDGRELYLGQVNGRGWGGGTSEVALQRVSWLGRVPFTVAEMHIQPGGFRLVFTAPVGAAALQPSSYQVTSMVYQPKWIYGGEAEDVRAEAVAQVVSVNPTTVDIVLPPLTAERVYALKFAETLTSQAGDIPAPGEFFYTANHVPSRVP